MYPDIRVKENRHCGSGWGVGNIWTKPYYQYGNHGARGWRESTVISHLHFMLPNQHAIRSFESTSQDH